MKATAGPHHHRFHRGDVMAENIGRWWLRLTEEGELEKHRKNIEFAMDCPRHLVSLQCHQTTLQRLREAACSFQEPTPAQPLSCRAIPTKGLPGRRQPRPSNHSRRCT